MILYVSPSLHTCEILEPNEGDPVKITLPTDFTWDATGQSFRRINYQYYLWLESGLAKLRDRAESGKLDPFAYLQALIVWRDIAERCAEKMDGETLERIRGTFNPAAYAAPKNPAKQAEISEPSTRKRSSKHKHPLNTSATVDRAQVRIRPIIPGIITCPHETHTPLSERPCPHLFLGDPFLIDTDGIPFLGGGPWCAAQPDTSETSYPHETVSPESDNSGTSPFSQLSLFDADPSRIQTSVWEFGSCAKILEDRIRARDSIRSPVDTECSTILCSDRFDSTRWQDHREIHLRIADKIQNADEHSLETLARFITQQRCESCPHFTFESVQCDARGMVGGMRCRKEPWVMVAG